MTSATYPTTPVIVWSHDGPYGLWQNDECHWVSLACGQEFHGSSRQVVAEDAGDALRQEMRDELVAEDAGSDAAGQAGSKT